MTKTKIAFVWFGMNGRLGIWRDGLWRAMKRLEEVYEVKYFEPSDDIEAFKPDVILFWEALCTSQSKDKDMWDKVVRLPYKKILLFAGGPIKKKWAEPFDHVCVESKINAEEMDALGIPNSTAFGINEEVFYPMKVKKAFEGIHHGACASWKRQWLVGEAVGKDGLVIGRYQETDPLPFNKCKEYGCTVLDEIPPEYLRIFVNMAHTCLQTSDYWGGGQRCTLEALACNVPVVAMTDSPKNMEYVLESGYGEIVEPSAPQIREAIERIKAWPPSNKGREYIESKWTSKHYAENLIKAINAVHH